MNRRSTKRLFLFIALLTVILIGGCSRHRHPDDEFAGRVVNPMNYTIQVGAFAVQDNAIRYTDTLRQNGLDAYYYIAKDKLYKVRFGDYSTRAAAKTRAEELKRSGLIIDYYIVKPELVAPDGTPKTNPDLRRDLIRTANRFLGCPYRYGGESEDGFDCSGLVMTIYRLNGLNLPRVSQDQYQAGRRVALSQLQAGDLVFFKTGNTRDVSHVGIYTGKGQFIHAPGKGKPVRVASLSTKYFVDRYVGARNYLDRF